MTGASGMEALYELLITSETTHIDFESGSEWGDDDWFLEILADIVSKKRSNLKQLSLDGEFRDRLTICPSISLRLRRNSFILPLLPEFLPTLKVLHLKVNLKLSQLSKIDSISLRQLYLNGTVYICDADVDFKRFVNLEFLYIKHFDVCEAFKEML